MFFMVRTIFHLSAEKIYFSDFKGETITFYMFLLLTSYDVFFIYLNIGVITW